MPFTETAIAFLPLAGFILLPIAIGMGSSMTAKSATDRIASFLPTATVSAYQLILSSYDAKEECTVGQRVLLWITLCVLTLVTAGMAVVQHKKETKTTPPTETEPESAGSLWGQIKREGWIFPVLRAVFSAMAFFFVSFLTPPAPECLFPNSGIPSGAAWITAVLLGSVMTLFALVFPTEVPPPSQKSRNSQANMGTANLDIQGDGRDIEQGQKEKAGGDAANKVPAKGTGSSGQGSSTGQ